MKKIFLVSILIGMAAMAFAFGNKDLPGDFSDTVTRDQLGSGTRYASYLSTDRGVYKPGDTLFIRALILEADTNSGINRNIESTIQVIGPRGDIYTEEYIYSNSGTFSNQWTIPSDLPGGEYTIKMNFSAYSGGFPPAERKIRILSYNIPRIKSDITFIKKGYFPGENVKASVQFERAEGGYPVGANVEIIARVDEKEIYRGSTSVNSKGTSTADFPLPDDIENGEGTLVFIIHDGGVTETASKTIPILMNNITIDFYPEGGDLIRNVENKVYFEVSFPNGKPADINARIIEGKNNDLGNVESVHEGRGFFSLTPNSKDHYYLSITDAKGKEKRYELPKARKGFTFTSLKNSFDAGKPLEFSVNGTEDASLVLKVYRHEKEIGSQKVKIKEGKQKDVKVFLPAGAQGVLRVTLWDDDKPAAERLIFRKADNYINIELSVDNQNPSPGDTVSVTVKTTDKQGNPVAAKVGIKITDDAAQSIIEKRELPPELLSMIFLENEVSALFDANQYLLDSLQSDKNLNLLLATQGWRRFAFYNWNDFFTEYGDKARRIAAYNEAPIPVEDNWNRVFLFGEAEAMPMQMERAAMAPMDQKNVKDKEHMVIDDRVVAGAPADAEQKQIAMVNEKIDLDQDKLLDIRADDELRLKDEIYRSNFIIVREYAHKKRNNWEPNQRIDFTETLYWNAEIQTDKNNGTAVITFDLNDSITSFKIYADAIGSTGSLGEANKTINSVKPFYLEPKMPLTITIGDVVELPAALINNSPDKLSGTIKIFINEKLYKEKSLTLKAGERTRTVFKLKDFGTIGLNTLSIKADFGTYSDLVIRKFTIIPAGFPIEVQNGGLIGPGQDVSFDVTIPQAMEKDSLRTSILVYPSPAANLTQALEALIRQPYGCFEQTSSTSYPLVMAQQYFMSHPDTDPALIKQSQKNLDAAYTKLTGFESPEEGYEWFGGDPGHEALTAYGLMQFIEMQQFMNVDQAMIERTKKWLMDRRNGKGGYNRNARALDSFGGAPEDTTDMYITWALLNAGVLDLEEEIKYLEEIAFATDDSYIQALAANALLILEKDKKAETLMNHLANKQEKDGSVTGAASSITRSYGGSLTMETTALSLLAWLNSDKHAGNVEKAMKYITDSCQGGMFYSTQGTILALKAIVLYDQKRSKPLHDGTIEIYLNNKNTGIEVSFTKEDKGTIELPDLSSIMKPGKNTITLKMKNGAVMPYSTEYKYYASTPASSSETRMKIDTQLTSSRINEGEATEMKVTISNVTKDQLPTPVAIIGIPGGLEVRFDQLKELQNSGIIDFFEINGQEVILYWRAIQPGQKVTLNISCIGSLPGSYTAPASRVYEYYTAEYKHWTAGESVLIK